MLLVCRPDTQEYLEKIERQREEKMRQEQGDNRSFFAKYVSFSLPFYYFMDYFIWSFLSF